MKIALPTADRPMVLGRYTLLEKLGEGGHGEVWRAHDATLGIEVALKLLSPALARSETAWEALEHEHEIAGRLDHPSILKVYSPQRNAEAAALPMELATGGDLRRLRGGSYLQIMPPLLEIAAALGYAHGHGVVHRDLKPGNVLFNARGRAMLADFGVAGAAFAAGRDKMRSGLSPFTSSPEQLRGEPPAVSDDIYGLGALAYELLAGEPPYYPHFDLERVLDLNETVPKLRTVQPTPPQLVAIVMHMLQKHPQSRPASMRAVIEDFEATMNDTLHFEFDAASEPQTSRREVPKPAIRSPRPVSVADAKPARPMAPAKTATPPEPRVKTGPSPIRTAAVAVALEAPRAPPSSRVTHTVEPAPMPQLGAVSAADRAAIREALPWEKIVPMSGLLKLDPIRARRWPWVMLLLLVAAAAAMFYALPRYGASALAAIESALPRNLWPAQMAPPLQEPAQPESAAQPPSTVQPTDSEARAQLRDVRAQFDRQMASLESRAAAVWGGQEFNDAKMRAAEALGADEAGNPSFAMRRLADARALLNAVEARAPAQLASQLGAGERALAAGRTQVAAQAFGVAQRIDPTNRKAAEGLQRTRNLEAARPLLADAANAEDAGDTARAQRDYRQILTLDPKNGQALAGSANARGASAGDDGNTKSFALEPAASNAGQRSEEPRAPLDNARRERTEIEPAPQAAPADAAQRARAFDAVHQRAAALEAQERWEEAMSEYDAALKSEPSLAFAQQGKTRAAARASLAQRLQGLIDRPEQLASAAARADAMALIETANEQSPSGPVLRSQVARLQILLPAFDTPVHLALMSDGATRVAIPSVGFTGVFSRRDIQLKPGKYTVVGTRNGYRDVRRDVTIAPGQDVQTISVSCGEPI